MAKRKIDAMTLTVSDLVLSRLSKEEILYAIKMVWEDALAHDDWGVGRYVRLDFTCRGKGYAVALDNRSEGIFCWIGLPQEVVLA